MSREDVRSKTNNGWLLFFKKIFKATKFLFSFIILKITPAILMRILESLNSSHELTMVGCFFLFFFKKIFNASKFLFSFMHNFKDFVLTKLPFDNNIPKASYQHFYQIFIQFKGHRQLVIAHIIKCSNFLS